MRQFDIGIEKQNVSALGLGRAQVAARPKAFRRESR
jgi:hypothetical protein